MRFERKRPKRVSTIAGPAACHLATKAASPASGVRAAVGTGNVGVCAKASATSLPNAALSRRVAGSSVAEHLHGLSEKAPYHSPAHRLGFNPAPHRRSPREE